MFFSGNSKKAETTAVYDDSILSSCHIIASVDGTLQIQPLAATLTTDQLSDIIGRLSCVECARGLKEIVFDLSHVEMIGPRWTVVLAMIIDFARSVAARCRLISLNSQPAAAAALYQHNTELMDLIASRNEARNAA